mgnify:CR=1 FL=1
MKVKIFAIACGCLFAVSAHAIVRRHDVPDAQYLAFGNVGVSQSVGMVTRGGFMGTGTYIGQGNGGLHWILTAAHVVDTTGNTTFQINGNTFNGLSANVFMQPGHNSNTLAFDLALYGIAANPGVAPIAMNNQSNHVGMNAVTTGFGNNGNGQTGIAGWDGQRRAAENTVDAFSNFGAGQVYWRTTFNSPGQAGILPLEGTTAQGDSGGPLFVNNQIIGVTSWGTSAQSLYGDLSYWTPIHPYTAWITQVSGIAAVPEPATMVVLGAGALALIRRRRNRAS